MNHCRSMIYSYSQVMQFILSISELALSNLKVGCFVSDLSDLLAIGTFLTQKKTTDDSLRTTDD